MKRILVCFVVCSLALPVFAARGSGTLVRLTGWIVDSKCGAENANAEKAEDTLACYKGGAKLLFLANDGTTYDIADQERAAEHVGEEVSVFGTVDGTRRLKVGRYIGREGAKKQEDRGGFGPEGHRSKPVKKD